MAGSQSFTPIQRDAMLKFMTIEHKVCSINEIMRVERYVYELHEFCNKSECADLANLSVCHGKYPSTLRDNIHKFPSGPSSPHFQIDHRLRKKPEAQKHPYMERAGRSNMSPCLQKHRAGVETAGAQHLIGAPCNMTAHFVPSLPRDPQSFPRAVALPTLPQLVYFSTSFCRVPPFFSRLHASIDLTCIYFL